MTSEPMTQPDTTAVEQESGELAIAEIPEDTANQTVTEVPAPEDNDSLKKGMKVLFLSSDTGGGHRASAQSLARQFELLFPGSTYDLLDLATETYLPPYNSIVSHYKHLSAHPSQWRMLYGVTNSRFMERAIDTNIKVISVVCERNIRKRIKSYEPDVVVSVHPLQTSVPILSCAKISHETGKHLPMFTVVTDLGSAHSTWFANGVEKMFVGSTQIYQLAKERGKVPDEKLVLLGLPIRHDFAVEADKLGDRMSPEGKKYQESVRAKLGLPATDRKTLLVMGGGEGVGSLSNIVDALYYEFTKQGIDAVICVVCGRNEKLKKELEVKDWDTVLRDGSAKKVEQHKARRSIFPTIPSMFTDLNACGEDTVATVGCIEAGGVTKSLRKILSSGNLMHSNSSPIFIPTPSTALEDEKKEEKAPEDSTDADHVATKKTENPRQKLQFKSVSIGPIAVSEDTKAGDENTSTENTEEAAASEADTEDENAAGQMDTSGVHSTISNESITHDLGKVDVVGLGFVTNMAEYMVAADVLVSKAGPGTISEAAALSLPVMLTSFLPGQEEGNVDYVIEGGFGSFCQDSDTAAVAEQLGDWLKDEAKMKQMSEAAKQKGAPNAARDIVQMIGDSTLKWREHNELVSSSTTQEAKPTPGTSTDTKATPEGESLATTTTSVTPEPVAAA